MEVLTHTRRAGMEQPNRGQGRAAWFLGAGTPSSSRSARARRLSARAGSRQSRHIVDALVEVVYRANTSPKYGLRKGSNTESPVDSDGLSARQAPTHAPHDLARSAKPAVLDALLEQPPPAVSSVIANVRVREGRTPIEHYRKCRARQLP